MEHKHFVTFEQEIMSFPCYETELTYWYNSKEELVVFRTDRNAIDKSVVNEEFIVYPFIAGHTNETNLLKEILTGIFSYSDSCNGWPYFIKSELITEDEFNEARNQGLEIIKENKNKAKEKGKDHPVIRYCLEKKLQPEPEDHSPDSWKANCPSGRQHHIMISISSPSSHNWGCGYCKKKGGLEELKQWVETKKS